MNTVIMSLSTVIERDLLLNFLDQFDRIIFNKAIDPKGFIAQIPHLQIRESTLSYMDYELTGKDSEGLFLKSKELKAGLNALHSVTIRVATMPTEDNVIKIREKLKLATDIPVIIDFKLDEAIIGGAIIESRGFITEYSFSQYFEAKRLARRKGDSDGL